MFWVFEDGEVKDWDLDFLVELLDTLEPHLRRLIEEADESLDPDGEGIIDRGESVIGLAFVACQTYMASTYGAFTGVEKRNARRCGPERAGVHVAELLHEGANLWKHQGEWSDAEPGRRERTLRVLRPAGVDKGETYPLGILLTAIVGGTWTLAALPPLLLAWREAARTLTPDPSGP